MKQVVISIFTDKNKILVEKRTLKNFDTPQYLIPGGKVEQTENLEAALKREIKEELGVIAKKFIAVPTEEIKGLKGQQLIPFLILEWEGQIPSKILDRNTPLSWVEFDQALDSIIPTKKIVQALVNYLKK